MRLFDHLYSVREPVDLLLYMEVSQNKRRQFQGVALRSEIQARNSLELSKAWIQLGFLTCLASLIMAILKAMSLLFD